MQNKGQETVIRATVIETLPNAMFKCTIDGTGEVMLTFLSGKMRLHRIRVLLGDKVEVVLDPYGGKGRIIRRI